MLQFFKKCRGLLGFRIHVIMLWFCVTERDTFMYSLLTDFKINFPRSTQKNLKNSAVNPPMHGLLEFFIFLNALANSS